jgi:hypothetical protein
VRSMKPKDQVRAWLEKQCGREVHVETNLDRSTASPLIEQGPLTRRRTPDHEIVEDPEDPAVLDLYEVGTASYNLADLPDDIDVQIRTEPAEQLEMTFSDGTSALIKVMVTVISEEGQK